MSTVTPVEPDATPRLRIGEAAAEAGMSTRTLRYYQELGLLTPSGTTAGGARRYSDADVARLHRIGHLRDLVGFNLTEIGVVLSAEDRLAEIRREWWAGLPPARRRELLHEAIAINADLQDAVRTKMAGLHEFLAGLVDRADSMSRRLAEVDGADLLAGS
jgi:DNA-binding transcriptional MerR regulator